MLSPTQHDVDEPLPGSTPIDITALNDTTCRWPVRSERAHSSPWAFCGLPVERARYCKTHGSWAYQADGPVGGSK